MWQNVKNCIDVCSTFLTLGCISFGGPIAHIGIFKQRFVQELGWLDGQKFAHFLVLCQCLSASSSQLGFLIGREHAGLFGGGAAFLGFTYRHFYW